MGKTSNILKPGGRVVVYGMLVTPQLRLSNDTDTCGDIGTRIRK